MPPAAAAGGKAGLGIIGDIAQYGTTAGALETATDVQNRGYQQSIQGMLGQQKSSQKAWDPYMQMGKSAVGQLQTPGGVQMDPGYQFAMQQGLNTMNQQAGSRGHFFAPQTMEALTAYGQNVGMQGYEQAFNHLMQQAGMGMQATGQQTQQGIGIQDMLSQLYQGNASMAASSAMAGAENQNQLIGGIQGSLQGMIPSPTGGKK